ncbi:hypothetical protein AK812_SmicGene23144 [Symbiodinium microadriaticum]|uniref:Uncharacterized protein n=1 Tax=Symbiodinium microadriaticum TaxID=2951 RepID=A0A1Q9DHY5_SYMMI|nr:hypothetical protein AK812_SmicGene23144 [Symbiodinium microadriaticum]
MLGREDDNPNSYDPPPSETVSGAASRATGSEPQQVMGAQIAGASTPHLLNGTYGTMGPMSMDSELRPHPEGREVQGNGSTERAGRAAGEPVAGALRTAGRVMANVAAKVQGMIPPAKVSSAASFLGQEEVRSAGTVGAGYVTAGSATMEEQHVEVEQQANEEPQASGAELFSPQQARRLREMEQEAPLLYSERRLRLSKLKFGDKCKPLWLYSPNCKVPGKSAAAQFDGGYAPQVRFHVIFSRWRWARVKHRMEHLIIQACSDSVRAELSSARVSGVLNILCKLHIIYKPGGVAERSEALKQVQHPKPADSAIDAVLKLRTWKRWMTRLSDLGGAQPDAALSIQALECITGNVLRSLPSLSFRINLVRASLHLDTQPTGAKVNEYFEHLLVELEAVSRVAEGPSPSLPLGAKTVLSDAAGVLREAIHASAGAADTAAHQPPSAGGSARGGGSEAGTSAEGPAMAAAAKTQAQLEDLEARVLDGRGPAVRAVSGAVEAMNSEQTAVLDSGATHAVLDIASAEGQDLVPCTVSLAGDQRQTWKQTPGGSLVAPSTGEGTTQTILPLGCLVDQLDCSVRWSKKGGMHLTHPRLGRLKTSLKGGCPQLNREQAMCLIKELESAKLGELTSRLKKVQAYLKGMQGLSLTDAIDAFVGNGDYGASLDLLQLMPFLKSVPDRIATRLAVDLKTANGWELLQALPFNRRVRKRMHQSHDWLLHLSSSPADSSLKRMCCDRQVELVELGATRGNLVSPSVWKVLCWAAFTGRVAGVVADAPMKTWGVLKVADSKVVRLRSPQHPWGEPGITTTLQAKVDDDVLTALQPMWLWTVASLSRGEGIPTCQTHALYPEGANECWMRDVVDPFLQWSNCSNMTIDSDRGVEGNTRPMKVCTNLGLPSGVAQASQKDLSPEDGPVVHGWSLVFRREVSMALFGGSLAAGHVLQKVPAVNAIGAEQLSSSPKTWLAQEHMQEATVAGQEGHGSAGGQPEVVDMPVLDSGGAREHQPAQAEDAQPTSRVLSDKEKEKWKRHIDAHHIPFRRDCLQCVMSGSLGLQHRRVKCPSMYSLAFDLTGPFVERGKDDRGGCYKYALVAGLRVPDIALPAVDPKTEVGANRPTKAPKARSRPKVMQSEPPVVEDDAPSEASWLQADLEPKDPLEPTDQEEPDDEDEPESVLSWFGAPDLESLKASLQDLEDGQEAAEDEPVGDGTEQKPSDGDPWDDDQGVSSLTDEQFDEELAKLLFTGANKVLRCVVPLKSRKGPQILSGLQEIVTDRAKELMSKAVMDWLQSKLIQPSFTQGLGVEQWPSAMEFACAEHRHRLLQLPGRIPRCLEELVDPEAELGGLYTADHCGRLLDLAFGGVEGGDPSALSWTALTVVVAPEVAVHRDVRNEPGSVNHVAQVESTKG